MKNEELLLLQSTKGIGDKSLLKICLNMKEHQVATLADLTESDVAAFKQMGRAAKPLLELISQGNIQEKLTHERLYIDSLFKSGIYTIGFTDLNYPILLKELDDPPPLLFAKGNISLLENIDSVAVVGTRNNTKRGELITQKTVQFLVDEGYCIVSGLALGVDAIAHQSALDNSGKTIAVLVDIHNIMPAANRGLASKVIESGGLLIAENRPNTSAIPAFFAKRDRIQAGLSKAVFAIETASDGGTMHAVKTAEQLCRKVYVPDAVLAGYDDLTISQLSGIQMLIEAGRAEGYTRKKYTEISKQLRNVI